MSYRDVSTQDELKKAIADRVENIRLCGIGRFDVDSAQVTACDSAQVTAHDSAQVTAYGSAQVRAHDSAQVRAYGSAQVTACGSAQVTAHDSAQVTAYDSAQVTACDSAQVMAASVLIAVTIHGDSVRCKGGTIIRVPPIESVEDWLLRYGIKPTRKRVTLYKALDGNYLSNYNAFPYTPGSTPIAPDWDGGVKECGGGLHFSPTPGHALRFNPDATRFIACKVKVADLRCPKATDEYQDKIKARGCCAPVWEVDINGDAIGESK